MIHFNVFLDSNIYISEKYMLSGAKFNKLRKLIESGYVSLICSEIVIGEVKYHLKDDIHCACNEYQKAVGHRGFESIRDLYGDKLSLFDEEELFQHQQKRFDDYLADCNAIVLSPDNVSITDVMNDHFSLTPPFTLNKKNEFKDSFIIKSLLLYQSNQQTPESELFIVSDDNGFCEALDNIPEIRCYRSFNRLLNYVVLSTEKPARAIQEMILGRKFDKKIHDWVEDYIWNNDIRIEEETEEFELITVNSIKYKIGYIDIEDDKSVSVTLEIEAEIDVNLTILDEEHSFFDKEDWKYLFTNYIELQETHAVAFEINLEFEIAHLDLNQQSSEGREPLISDEVLQDFSNITVELMQIDNWSGFKMILDDDSRVTRKILRETHDEHDDDSWVTV